MDLGGRLARHMGAATFREGVETLKDLAPGMMLEGTVTNVTNFGAFVDIGVHQDGLVHISALADRFVKDPHSVVQAGQVVKVKVLEVDLPRKRIALTMRMGDEPVPSAGAAPADGARRRNEPKTAPQPRRNGGDGRQDRGNAAGGAMADALARALRK